MTAVNAAGTSAASNVATATTWTPIVIVPTAPPAAPATLTATAKSASSVALSWAAVTYATAYAVDRSANGGQTFATVATGVTSTAYTDAGLSAATAYAYRVRATNAMGSSVPSPTATTTTAAGAATPTPTAVSLTTLTPTSATVGWGTLGTNVTIRGNPLKLRGTTYATGLGAHATSAITYAVAGRYASLTVDVGVDDEVNGLGSVDFALLGDNGAVLYDSGVRTGTAAVARATVNLTGVNTLTLRATPGVAGSIDYDHADWANPQLTPATATAAPAGQASGALGGTAIGTAGSSRAVDGNLSTYFDGTAANGQLGRPGPGLGKKGEERRLRPPGRLRRPRGRRRVPGVDVGRLLDRRHDALHRQDRPAVRRADDGHAGHAGDGPVRPLPGPRRQLRRRGRGGVLRVSWAGRAPVGVGTSVA